MRFNRMVGLVLVLVLLCVAGLTSAQDNENRAQVKSMAVNLNIRQYPSPQSTIITELTAGTSLSVLARTYGDGWVLVKTDAAVIGWVDAGFLEYDFDFDTLPYLRVNVPDDEGEASDPDVSSEVTTTSEVTQGGETGIEAAVRDMGSTLRMRTAPNLFSSVVTDLKGRTPLTVNGRSGTQWLYVATNDDTPLTGWVSAEFIDLPRGFDLTELAVVGDEVETSAATRESSTTGTAPISGNLTEAGRIYLRGKELGNRGTVFAKVGDSITVAKEMYDAVGRGMYNLGSFSGLEAVIDQFNTEFNSFTHVTAAAGPGWTSATVLNPNFADASVCASGVTPLECEYGRIKPAIALIMLGTNDMQYFNTDEYAFNMNRIVEISKANGVIPVLSTIPFREGYAAQVEAFNQVVRRVASAQSVPLWDYNSAMNSLPNYGLSADGMHPSIPSGGYQDSANFTGANLTSGYVIRNLTALQVLDSVWRSAIIGR